MTFHPLSLRLIDAPEFQRLRNLKQLGFCYWVFPAASHNRFEHSLGTGFLARKMAEELQRKQSLDITPEDLLCVEIAGLCHDLGHGPFSHSWQRFVRAYGRAKGLPRLQRWKHEQMSPLLLQHIIDRNDLMPEFRASNLGEDHVGFIKSLMDGTGNDHPFWEKKSFLWDIVANKRNGIDVDKCDYFLRDSHLLGLQNTFEYGRMIELARVLLVPGQGLRVCFPKKEASNLLDMFYQRAQFFRRAYMHRVTCVLESMFIRAMLKANDAYRIPVGSETSSSLAEACLSPEAFVQLDDSIFWAILHSNDPSLGDAARILERMQTRKLYRVIKEAIIPQQAVTQEAVAQQAVTQACPSPERVFMMFREALESHFRSLLPIFVRDEDYSVYHIMVDFGKLEEYPLRNVSFYSKDSPDTPLQLKDDSLFLVPKRFLERKVLLLSCTEDEKINRDLENAFSMSIGKFGLIEDLFKVVPQQPEH
ncbi:unnamed protein product [Darwinula stevensoni]|uniref:HD domain-containing protein n=1 Tax=Darwinula stevensoni TaxID=69355 RepID=A0A7R8X6V1_9CRUS|nr:unnamed protein product [Darwinula stevensoni]CAG0886308.1 unnamed protein product [Darwinula stevensoni]